MPEPTREIFWNVSAPWIMYALATIATAIFIWALIRIPRRWRTGQPANRFNHLWRRTGVFLRTAFTDIVIHRKFLGADRKDWRARAVFAGGAAFFFLVRGAV